MIGGYEGSRSGVGVAIRRLLPLAFELSAGGDIWTISSWSSCAEPDLDSSEHERDRSAKTAWLGPPSIPSRDPESWSYSGDSESLLRFPALADMVQSYVK